MSLHYAAKHLASKGRNGDTELVHMTKNEIKGLQELALAHGGSLSINPDTGLVEASWLENLLPTIAGIGLNMMFPGSGMLIGAGVGAFEAARTGDIGKGLMAGLGAYGGAGLGQSLASAGAANVAPGVVDAAGTAGLPQGVSPAVQGINPTAATLTPATTPTATSGFMQNASNTMQGLKDVTASGQAAMDFGKKNLMNIGMAAAPALSDAMAPQTPTPGQAEEDPRYKGSPYRYNLASNFQGASPIRPNPYYTPTGLGYAAGGDIMMAAGGTYDDEPRGDDQGFGYAAGGEMKIGEGIAKDTDEDTASLGAYDAAKKRMSKINKAANMPKGYAAKVPEVRGLGELSMAMGGSIGGYSDGGRMLKGPGDGMSDSIPATIGRKQPARLADGEFVVPADVVSHLGNGSTDAGARKLYGMMDKIRTARTGKKKQAPAVKADKYMPA